MRRSKDEAEVIVRLDYLEKKAHICVCQWPAMAAKIRKRYGPSLDPGGKFVERWVVPLKAISFGSLGGPGKAKDRSGWLLCPFPVVRTRVSRSRRSRTCSVAVGARAGVNEH